MAWNGFPPEFKLGAEEQAKVDAYLALIEERSRALLTLEAERDMYCDSQIAWQEKHGEMMMERDALKVELERAMEWVAAAEKSDNECHELAQALKLRVAELEGGK